MSAPMKPVELTVVDTNTAEWQGFPVEYINATLEHIPLVNDTDTGMMVLKMVYRAGFTNPWHSHSCAHGVYVLEGVLNTHQGDYPAALTELARLRHPVDAFFSEVMVMAEDGRVRFNRLSLLAQIAVLFRGLADFAKIVTEA